MLAVVLAGVLGILGSCAGTENGTDDLVFEPVGYTGTDPFTASVGSDMGNVAARPEAGGVTSGDTPGLYGGSGDRATCDKELLANFLDANPDKAEAWAGVRRIPRTEIRRYLRGLTPLVLRAATLVINHGFKGGRAIPIRSILQEGVAVLVDQFGTPVVKCNCGNPLAVPPSSKLPNAGSGGAWPGYTPDKVVIVQPTVNIINVFVIVNLNTGQVVETPPPPVPTVSPLPSDTDTPLPSDTSLPPDTPSTDSTDTSPTGPTGTVETSPSEPGGPTETGGTEGTDGGALPPITTGPTPLPTT